MSGNTFNDKPVAWGEWSARSYLNEYFQEVSPDVHATTEFVVKQLSIFRKTRVNKMLDFGSGPTIIGALTGVPCADEVHVADYLEDNLKEIRHWANKASGAFDWDPIISHILRLEGINPSLENIAIRVGELREKMHIFHCDAGKKWPIPEVSTQYPLIISLYCADSATNSKAVWQTYMANIINLLEPSGTILIAALRNCSYYSIGSHTFPSANINESDLLNVFLANNLPKNKINIEVVKVPERDSEGFTSILLASAEREQ